MKRIKRTAAGIMTACLIGIFLFSGCGTAGAGGEKTLNIGVRGDIEGWSYYDKNSGQYYGFEIDLAEEMARRMGYENVNFITVTADSRKKTLMTGKADCLVASYSVSDTRRENFDFSPVYYKDESRIMVMRSTLFTGIKDLVGRKIGVLEDSDTAPEMSEKMIGMGLFTAQDPKGTSAVKMASIGEMAEALQESSVDAIAEDGVLLQSVQTEDMEILPDSIKEEDYAVATEKGSDLSGKVKDTVQDMLDDGTVDTFIGKWTGGTTVK